jgi:hypothetical protein
MTTSTLSATYTETQLQAALEAYMHDSDPANIDSLATQLTNNGANSVTAIFAPYDATQEGLHSQ